MREIVLDTETTGLEPELGHRLVEIACIELNNHLPTGLSRRWYVNPERDMPGDAFAVHGIEAEFLKTQPRFAEIADELLSFIEGAPLIIHNAGFDLTFLNAELSRAGRPPLPPGIAVDTLELARRKFPGAQASLEALCRRFAIDLSARVKHGALIDAELLAQVYLELVGGRQPGLALIAGTAVESRLEARIRRAPRAPRPHAPSVEELAAHRALIERLNAPLWLS